MKNSTKIIAALSVVAGLGVAMLPLSSYAATNSKTKIQAQINETLSIATNYTGGVKTVNITDLTAANETLSEVLSVTANKNGYKLNVKADTSANMNNADNSDSINALAADGTLTAGKWGLKNVNPSDGTINSTNYIAVSTTDKTIAHVATPVADNTNTITYGIFPKPDQKAGTYTVDLTYTVVANN